jgi:ABC-type bacteriocin/lantibiotic exporter with double-glycine peptidase domain
MAQSEAGNWRDEKRCGVNALYALLALHDKKVDQHQLEQVLIPGPGGCSMMQLKEAANHFGLDCELVQTTPQKLSTVVLPAIAHYSGVRDGHFVVILSVRPKTVVVSDLTACEIQELNLDQFTRQWSGFLLVKASHRGLFSNCLLALGAFVTLCLVAQLIREKRSRSVTKTPAANEGSLRMT